MPSRIQIGGENVSKPVKRMRWATQRVAGPSALKKRMSIVKRFQRRPPSTEEKPQSRSHDTEGSDSSASEDRDNSRRIFFNLPLPNDAKDEDGNIRESYARNKIRTAKYTPLSFIPKNLWFQFHNTANIYFLFIIILQVAFAISSFVTDANFALRFSQSLVHQTLD